MSDLHDAISRERLSKYLARTGGQVGLALDLYAWNQEVGAALTVTLAQVEVCLRNQVARVLADAYGPAWHRVARLRNAHAEVQHGGPVAGIHPARAVETCWSGSCGGIFAERSPIPG